MNILLICVFCCSPILNNEFLQEFSQTAFTKQWSNEPDIDKKVIMREYYTYKRIYRTQPVTKIKDK